MAKRNKNKNVFLMIGIIVLILTVLISMYFFVFQQTFFTSSILVFDQYTGRPVNSDGTSNTNFPQSGIYFQNSIFQLGNDKYEFISTVSGAIPVRYCKSLPSGAQNAVSLGLDSDGCEHWSYFIPGTNAFYSCSSGTTCSNYKGTTECDPYGLCKNPQTCFPSICTTPKDPKYWAFTPAVPEINDTNYGGVIISTSDPITGEINRGCYVEVDVFRNDELVDQINITSNGDSFTYYDTFVDPNILITNPLQLNKCDGLCGNRVGVMGIGIKVQDADWFVGSSCISIKNRFELYIPTNALDISINSPSGNVEVNKPAFVNVNITNSLGNVNSTIILDLKNKGLLGAILTTKVFDKITLMNGENFVSLNLPTNQTSNLVTITPTVQIFYPTKSIDGVSQNLQNVKSFDFIDLGTYTGSSTNITITSSGESSSNQTSSSQTGIGGGGSGIDLSTSITKDTSISINNTLCWIPDEIVEESIFGNDRCNFQISEFQSCDPINNEFANESDCLDSGGLINSMVLITLGIAIVIVILIISLWMLIPKN